MNHSQLNNNIHITDHDFPPPKPTNHLDRYCFNFLKNYPRVSSRQQRIHEQMYPQQRAQSYEENKKIKKNDYPIRCRKNQKQDQSSNYYSEWIEFSGSYNQSSLSFSIYSLLENNLNLSKLIRVIKAPQLKIKTKMNLSFKTEKSSPERQQSHSTEIQQQAKIIPKRIFNINQSSLDKFPKLTARSYVVYNSSQKKIIQSHKPYIRRQVASLTKIITCLTAIEIITKHKIEIDSTFVRVHRSSTKIKGTSANLRQNHVLSLKDLLYGMMLPSGNDAAQTIADGLGYFLYKIKKEIIKQDGQNPLILDQCGYSGAFISKMNSWKLRIPLINSNFDCAHGLANKLNISSAMDITLASAYAMKQKLFQEIVKTEEYQGMNFEKKSYQYNWKNTNKLLQKGYNGIKTGNTDPAGPCLASSINIKENNYIIVVLNCRSAQERFEEIERIVSWLRSCQQEQF